jgi:hypothetical protein
MSAKNEKYQIISQNIHKEENLINIHRITVNFYMHLLICHLLQISRISKVEVLDLKGKISTVHDSSFYQTL